MVVVSVCAVVQFRPTNVAEVIGILRTIKARTQQFVANVTFVIAVIVRAGAQFRTANVAVVIIVIVRAGAYRITTGIAIVIVIGIRVRVYRIFFATVAKVPMSACIHLPIVTKDVAADSGAAEIAQMVVVYCRVAAVAYRITTGIANVIVVGIRVRVYRAFFAAVAKLPMSVCVLLPIASKGMATNFLAAGVA